MPRRSPAATPREVRIALARAPARSTAGRPLPPGVCYAAACRLAGRLDLLLGPGGGAAPEPAAEIAARLGLPRAAIERLRALAARAAAIARDEERRAARLGARLVTPGDPGYPAALGDLELPPPCLVVAGRLPGTSDGTPEAAPNVPPPPAVAIVGSRRASAYGREAAEWFGRALAAAGVVVVSGLARGVDAAAHRGALAARRAAPAAGATVAVLGAGVDLDYPRGHRRLREEIAATGAVVTEFPCGAPPRPWRFPVRNRLIAALADAVLVVEAAERSGSLITARFALDLGREVFAVPGRVFDDRAAGANRLIADGAQVAQAPRDLLERLGVSAPAPPPAGPGAPAAGPGAPAAGPGAPAAGPGDSGSARGPAGASAAESPPTPFGERVLAALVAGEPRSAERVAAAVSPASGAAIERVLATLAELELAGRVRRWPGPAFTARP